MKLSLIDPVRSHLRELFRERVRFDEPLARHTSFRIGGPADALVRVESPEEIHSLLRLAAASQTPLTVLGSGTNVLVSDLGVRGIVLKLGQAFQDFEWTEAEGGVLVCAGAAARLARLVKETVRRTLTGLEFAEGIPGSVGGGLRMNAGAFGGEIAGVLRAVLGVDQANGARRMARDELRHGYRFFDLPQGFVVTHIELRLEPGDAAAIRTRVEETRARRRKHQPAGVPNAGSIFKNPPGAFAGRLIEEAGLKGRRVGGAMVSPRHANFIVNVEDATAEDVRRLMDEVTEAVWRGRAIRLVPEIKLLGDWGGCA